MKYQNYLDNMKLAEMGKAAYEDAFYYNRTYSTYDKMKLAQKKKLQQAVAIIKFSEIDSLKAIVRKLLARTEYLVDA